MIRNVPLNKHSSPRWMVGFLLLALAGCQSAWETSFEPAAGPSAPLAAAQPVSLRRVPWERLDAALVNLEADLAQSDTHVSEWPQDRLDEREAELLTALQISDDPARVTVLGRSVFRSTEPIEPDDGNLEAFARKIGATHAVWSARYQGKTTVIEREPVTTTGYVWDGTRDRFGSDRDIAYNETTYIPVVVEADEYAWVAYFLKVE